MAEVQRVLIRQALTCRARCFVRRQGARWTEACIPSGQVQTSQGLPLYSMPTHPDWRKGNLRLFFLGVICVFIFWVICVFIFWVICIFIFWVICVFFWFCVAPTTFYANHSVICVFFLGGYLRLFFDFVWHQLRFLANHSVLCVSIFALSASFFWFCMAPTTFSRKSLGNMCLYFCVICVFFWLLSGTCCFSLQITGLLAFLFVICVCFLVRFGSQLQNPTENQP